MSTLFSQARTRIPRFADAAVERARLTVVPSPPVDAPRAPFVVLVVIRISPISQPRNLAAVVLVFSAKGSAPNFP